MDFKLSLCITVLLKTIAFCSSNAVTPGIRLSGGDTPAIGRLEVYQSGTWGTVCDDGWHNTWYYTLVCKNLGYSSGRKATQEEKANLGQCDSSLPIVWDDTHCDPGVSSLSACAHQPGPGNCNHGEDVHVVCDASNNPPTSKPPTTKRPPSSRGDVHCDTRLHHITPYDPKYPWIGRAEVVSQDGSRHAICDDYWDDNDAEVFCKCFEGTLPCSSGYKAFWKKPQNNLNWIDMKYSAVHCSSEDAQGAKRNLFYCDVQEEGKEQCDVMTEAAGVACGPIPINEPSLPPEVTISCSSQVSPMMEVCFESQDSSYTLKTEYLELFPKCAHTTTIQSTSANGLSKVCLEVNMDACETSHMYTSPSNKTYCYDVRYSQYDRYPGVPMTDNVWSRVACCEMLKNGTVSANFMATEEPPTEKVVGVKDLSFDIMCYNDESFSGHPLMFPANVTRGQDLFCKVTVETWDERLFLVVPTCQFSATAMGYPHFEFWAHNCPQSDALPVSYYNLGNHTWGLQFTVPLFQNHESLFLSCGSYVCDRQLDEKPYCDRSCTSPRRTRRAVHQSATLQSDVKSGEFHVQDNGFGPLITRDGIILDIEGQEVKVKVGKEVRRVTFQQFEHIPDPAEAEDTPISEQSTSVQKSGDAPSPSESKTAVTAGAGVCRTTLLLIAVCLLLS